MHPHQSLIMEGGSRFKRWQTGLASLYAWSWVECITAFIFFNGLQCSNNSGELLVRVLHPLLLYSLYSA